MPKRHRTNRASGISDPIYLVLGSDAAPVVLHSASGSLTRMRIAGVVTALLLSTGCAEQGRIDPPEPLWSWGESGHAPGELFQPTGIAVSPQAVFVADTGNDRVQAFDADGTFLRAFGESGEAPGQFRRPMDLDIDAAGRVYVAELGGDRVQVFTPSGDLVQTFRGENTPAGPFDGAAGVLVSPGGDVYVADFYNHRIVRFGAGGEYLGILGVPGRILSGRLHYPTDLAWLRDRLIVADAYNNRVQLLSREGEAVSRWGGPFGLGVPGSRGGWFRVATGVATDTLGRIYVADFENHRIQAFDDKGRLLSMFGDRGSDLGEFEHPTDLDIAADGRIYVVDFGNHRIQIFSPLGQGDA